MMCRMYGIIGTTTDYSKEGAFQKEASFFFTPQLNKRKVLCNYEAGFETYKEDLYL